MPERAMEILFKEIQGKENRQEIIGCILTKLVKRKSEFSLDNSSANPLSQRYC
jgi:hypothetical protein